MCMHSFKQCSRMSWDGVAGICTSFPGFQLLPCTNEVLSRTSSARQCRCGSRAARNASCWIASPASCCSALGVQSCAMATDSCLSSALPAAHASRSAFDIVTPPASSIGCSSAITSSNSASRWPACCKRSSQPLHTAHVVPGVCSQ